MACRINALRLWCGGLVLSLGAPVLAQDINVIGRKPEEVRREAKEFVRVTGVAERPVARWIDPVCPEILGVPAETAARVEARIRQVAREAEVRLAKPRCTGNLRVVFTDAAQAIVAEVHRRSPASFEDASKERRAALLGPATPIRWWYTSQQRTKDGMRSFGNDVPPGVQLDGIGGVPLGGQVYQQYRPSFLSTQMVRAIISAQVIVDVKLAEGVPLDSVADYAALVGLAEIQLDDEAPAGSILSLFAADGPRALTPLDTNFLRTLYRLPLDRTATAQRGLLVRGLVNGGG